MEMGLEQIAAAASLCAESPMVQRTAAPEVVVLTATVWAEMQEPAATLNSAVDGGNAQTVAATARSNRKLGAVPPPPAVKTGRPWPTTRPSGTARRPRFGARATALLRCCTRAAAKSPA